MSGAPLGPIHHCPTCGGAVDPLQAATPDGGCAALACRLRARERFESERMERLQRRVSTAQRRLRSRGLDPAAEPWALVPRNDASEVELDPGIVAEFRRHLAHVIDESRTPRAVAASRAAARDVEPDPATVDAERAALARGCATCRGWCCRRGGSHAFLDRASLERVQANHPDWSTEQVVAAYLDHLGATHLAGGCLFQGPRGCRLPTALRSDTCNDWWCPDLLDVRARWARGRIGAAETTFVAVDSEPAAIDTD